MSPNHPLLRLIPAILLLFGAANDAITMGILPSAPAHKPHPQTRAPTRLGQLSLHFEPNQGQVHDDVAFTARGPSYQLFLTHTGMTLSLPTPSRSITVRSKAEQRTSSDQSTPQVRYRNLRLSHVGIGLNPQPVTSGRQRLGGQSHYFRGREKSRWQSAVPHFARVHYQELYPGIDLALYGNEGQLEYDFIVAPGAEPNRIRLSVDGADSISVNSRGDLVFKIGNDELIQHAPVIYQERNNQRHPIAGAYRLHETRPGEAPQIGFQLARYDTSLPLIIDPVLAWSTYLGGGQSNDSVLNPAGIGRDEGYAIDTDSEGNVYVTGSTTSTDFLTANALDDNINGSSDAFVVKLDSSATHVIYATYLGGSSVDVGRGIAIDANGNALVTGSTQSSNFPTTSALDDSVDGASDAFVVKLDSSGASLVYATYLGGSDRDDGHGIAVDAGGNALVTGQTQSSDFPIANALDDTFGGSGWDAFVAKLDPSGTHLVYATYLGGELTDRGRGIATDAAGNAFVTGQTWSNDFSTSNALDDTLNGPYDAFVAKLDPNGTRLVYATYLGGEDMDDGRSITIDAAGNALVTGSTESSDFPTANALNDSHNGGADAFVAKLNASGTRLVYATYLGGSGSEEGYSITADTAGNALVTGSTESSDFPLSNALDDNYNGNNDAFVAKLGPNGSHLIYATYLGGEGQDSGFGITTDAAGNALLTGRTQSGNFPTVNALDHTLNGSYDTFVAKLINQEGFGSDQRLDLFWHHTRTGRNVLWFINDLKDVRVSTVNVVKNANEKIVGFGDFDGDGIKDALWRNTATGDNGLYLIDANGNLSERLTINQTGRPWKVIGVADFDGDGKADIGWRNARTGANYLYKMDKNRILTSKQINTVGLQWNIVGVGDLDGDHKADIVWRNQNSGVNYLYLMDGQTIRKSQKINRVAAQSWQVKGLGDFNADGKMDILWRNTINGKNWLYEMDGVNIVKSRQINRVPAKSAWHIVAIGDLTGDRRADIVWRHARTGKNLFYRMNANTIEQVSTINRVKDTHWQVINLSP